MENCHEQTVFVFLFCCLWSAVGQTSNRPQQWQLHILWDLFEPTTWIAHKDATDVTIDDCPIGWHCCLDLGTSQLTSPLAQACCSNTNCHLVASHRNTGWRCDQNSREDWKTITFQMSSHISSPPLQMSSLFPSGLCMHTAKK